MATATGDWLDVRSPYSGDVIGRVARGGAAEARRALDAAERALQEPLAAHERARILDTVARLLEERHDEAARLISAEAGKPMKAARVEAQRAVSTFTFAAVEARKLAGEVVPMDASPAGAGKIAWTLRRPIGIVGAISPFNFPLNLVAHKVAPALAAGCPIVLRPASQTPISALKLAEIVLEAGWPEDAFAVVPSTTADAAPLVEDDRIKLLTFTGSPVVGWGLKPRAGRKRVTLELGGNAAVIVHSDADRGYAAERITWGATVQSGQTCISVQRVYAHESLQGFAEELAERFERLVVGDPLDDATDIGPLIDGDAADRVEEWLREAVDGGATILAGGGRDGNTIQPTVLTGIREEMRISCEEAFAPVVGVYGYADVADAIRAAATTEFGLQGGIFTNDLRVIERAFDEIDVGGLMVNDVSTFRVDHMPYGGVKSSGAGREGLRYAIEEMTELKLLTFNSRGGL
jgi:acyl-CoA reductase-like NAD-dependent aldehyde dehydrogenase